MRWNTDKYTIGIFGCDTDNCNKDLDQGDCAHVCEEKKETGMEKPQVKEQVSKIDIKGGDAISIPMSLNYEAIWL